MLNAGLWSSGGGREGKVMPVVVDPYLARSLRPHQEEGIRFMYRWGRIEGGVGTSQGRHPQWPQCGLPSKLLPKSSLPILRCTMESQSREAAGCILADEMGLGKTLQVIALVWTLLRQGPGPDGKAAAQKVIVVTPVSTAQHLSRAVICR